jgi:hypothetical protein
MELAVTKLWMYKCYYLFFWALGATFRLLWDLERLDCLVRSRHLHLDRCLTRSARSGSWKIQGHWEGRVEVLICRP